MLQLTALYCIPSLLLVSFLTFVYSVLEITFVVSVYCNHLLSWTPLLTFSFLFVPVFSGFLVGSAWWLCIWPLSQLCKKPSICSFKSMPMLYLLPLQTTNSFLKTNIVKGEMRVNGAVGWKTTSKWTYAILQHVPCIIHILSGICTNCPGHTWLCYLVFCPAALPLQPRWLFSFP